VWKDIAVVIMEDVSGALLHVVSKV